MIPIDVLLQRAKGDLEPDSKTMFKPSMAYDLLHDPFKVWCEYHAPREEAVEEISRYDEIKMQRGVVYEDEWVKRNYPEARKIEPEFGFQALKNSLQAMSEGVPAIHAPQLWLLLDEIYGKADVLLRDDSAPSDMGNFHYRVVEIKRSSKLREYQTLQAAIYNRILGHIQGYVPPMLTVVLRDGEENIQSSDVDSNVNKLLEQWRGIRDGAIHPEPKGLNKTDSPWRVFANRLLHERMDLTLLPDIGPAGRGTLREKLGIDGIRDLYTLSKKVLIEKLGNRTGTEIYYHAMAYKQQEAIRLPGVDIKIPRARRHIYFDFETSDELHRTEPPHIYLIGAWDAEKQKFVYFLGRGMNDEPRIFNEFFDYVKAPENCCLYHWTDFEIGEMKEAVKRHPEISARIDKLIRFCIDLKEVIKSQVYLPVPTYSIKSVAPALGFNWRHKDVDAMESMVLYWEYLETGDESKIKKVLDYNEDDCVAMAHADQAICQKFGMPYIS